MDRTEALSAIKDMVADGSLQSEIVDYLIDEGVPKTTAYRWIKEVKPIKDPEGNALVLKVAEEAFMAIQAEDNNWQTLKAAAEFAKVLKAMGRV